MKYECVFTYIKLLSIFAPSSFSPKSFNVCTAIIWGEAFLFFVDTVLFNKQWILSLDTIHKSHCFISVTVTTQSTVNNTKHPLRRWYAAGPWLTRTGFHKNPYTTESRGKKNNNNDGPSLSREGNERDDQRDFRNQW